MTNICSGKFVNCPIDSQQKRMAINWKDVVHCLYKLRFCCADIDIDVIALVNLDWFGQSRINVTAQIPFIYFFRNQSDIRFTNSNSACHRTSEQKALRFVCYAHANWVSRFLFFLNGTTDEFGMFNLTE